MVFTLRLAAIGLALASYFPSIYGLARFNKEQFETMITNIPDDAVRAESEHLYLEGKHDALKSCIFGYLDESEDMDSFVKDSFKDLINDYYTDTFEAEVAVEERVTSEIRKSELENITEKVMDVIIGRLPGDVAHDVTSQIQDGNYTEASALINDCIGAIGKNQNLPEGVKNEWVDEASKLNQIVGLVFEVEKDLYKKLHNYPEKKSGNATKHKDFTSTDEEQPEEDVSSGKGKEMTNKRAHKVFFDAAADIDIDTVIDAMPDSFAAKSELKSLREKRDFEGLETAIINAFDEMIEGIQEEGIKKIFQSRKEKLEHNLRSAVWSKAMEEEDEVWYGESQADSKEGVAELVDEILERQEKIEELLSEMGGH